MTQVADGILAQYGDAVRIDELWNTVVNLRINMIRTSAEDDAHLSGFCQVGQCLLAFRLNVQTNLF